MIQDNSHGKGVAFLVLWIAIANGTPYSSEAFMLALAIVAMGWLATQMLVAAAIRLGDQVWVMLCQLVGLCVVVIWLYPAPFGLILFWVVMAGLPLFMSGILVRTLDRLPAPVWVIQRALAALAVNAALGVIYLTHSITLALVWTVGAAVVFGFGWLLGAPRAAYRHDAQMGESADFDDAGYSRER